MSSNYNPFPPLPPRPAREEVEPLWTLRKGDRIAQARIYPHVLGVELRITDSKTKDFARTQVHRSSGRTTAQEAAELDAMATYERLRDEFGFEPA